MDTTITYLHLFTPILLSLPLPRLFSRAPDDDPELPGIRPVTVRVVTPRRSWILLALTLLALSSTLDAARLIADIATTHAGHRGDHGQGGLGGLHLVQGLPLWAEIAYAFGGLCVWAGAAIAIEYRARWADGALVGMGLLGLAIEIPNLVLLVQRQTRHDDLFNILAIPPSALRLLLLPLLIVLVARPVVRYEPASETSALLAPDATYGTFPESSAASASTPKPDGAATTGPNIPKTLGEMKKEDKPLSWGEIWSRLKTLSPRLWPSTSPRLQLFVVLCIVSIIAMRFVSPLAPILLGNVVEELISAQAGEPSHPLTAFAAWIGLRLTMGSSGVASFINNAMWVPIAQYTDREMQMVCFNHLLDLSLAYHTKRNTGEVLKIIDRGSAINNLFQTLLFTAIPTILDIIISFGVFFYLYGGTLALVTLGIMVAYVVFSVTQTNWRMRLRRVMVDKDVKQRGIVSDVLTNWESVKYFTAEERESRRFREAIVSYQETEARVQIGFNLLFLVQFTLLTLGLALGSLIIAFRILDGKASAASFVVFTQYYAQLQGPLNNFGWLYRIFNQETTDAEKMFTLLAQATEVTDKPGAKDLVVTDGVIEFDNVVFSYDGKVDALKGVSFRLGKGESLALVGESGSGKSTILRLLYRFYDITSGHIYIDGQDISQVTQLSLRRAIGIVPQDSVLWNDTIGANVSYGKEGADDDEIIAAAKAARLHDRIMGFPEQYETVVGERGVRLSGGEKQRVSLARMFLKSPAILVLDEATSALDTETEREIQRALAELAKGRSSLSIAHRLSTIINSDQIVVMKDGRVIEIGGYKALLEQDGVFASMWKKQIFTEAEMMAMSTLPSGLASAAGSGGATPKGKEKEKEEAEVDVLRRAAEDLIQLEVGKDVEGEEKGEGEPAVKVDLGEEAEKSDKAAAVVDEVQDGHDKAGYDVADAPASYAAAVKENIEDEGAGKDEAPSGVAIKESATAPTQPVVITTDPAPAPATAPAPAPAPASEPALAAPAAAATSSLTDSPRSSPARSHSSNRVSFPGLPGLSHSASHRSDLSASENAEAGPSTPGSASASASAPASKTDLAEGSGGGNDKRRKRLSSLNAFVRRISDQGVSRSNSFKSFIEGSPKSPAAQLPGDGAQGSQGTQGESGGVPRPQAALTQAGGTGGASGGGGVSSAAGNGNGTGNGGGKKKNKKKGGRK